MTPTIEIPTADGRTQEVPIGSTLPDALPVLPLKDSVPFPDSLIPLAVAQPRSVELVNDVLGGNRMLAMVASRDGEIENPGPEDLYTVGVAGYVARMLKVPDGSLRILVQGAQRVELGETVQRDPYLIARIAPAPDALEPSSSSRRCFATSSTRSRRSSSRCPTCPRSCSSRSPTSRIRRSSRT